MDRIIIADDSETARMFIKRCLEIIGLRDAQFLEAANGRDALQLAKEQFAKGEPVDLLVSDLNMPVMDGVTLLKWVKTSPRLVQLPVLIITSAGNPAKEQELMEQGALAVLNKPVSPANLLKALGSMIDTEDGYA
ncbi:response regulator [Geoalkalibacter subterraneus]|uniref:Histidine kinase n=1 Tax=Geoalkalibacter subterraneus TaxID=483547 RepID=A0A0B5FVK0_9BACT|nr:response regulator [Geoalkalibacter subterraneus]AJF07606.1 histidine kinase [Geoalkalibacter subterraneus]